jgi:hypothetical protein
MARTPEREEGARDRIVRARVTEIELEIIDRAAEARGLDRSELVRAIAPMLSERDQMMRTVLRPVRGRLTDLELRLILDVMNGTYDELSSLGQIAPNVEDAIRLNGLDRKWACGRDRLLGVLRDLSRAERAALELWCADLWRRYTDDALWEREIAWLSDPKAPHPADPAQQSNG